MRLLSIEDTVCLFSINNIQVGVEEIVLHWCQKLSASVLLNCMHGPLLFTADNDATVINS